MVCFTLKRVQGAFSQDSGSLWKPSSQPRRLMLPNLRGTDARTRGENAVRIGGGTARPTGWGSGWQTRPGAHTHSTTAGGSGGRWVPGHGDGAPQTWGRPPEVERSCHPKHPSVPRAWSREGPRTAAGSRGLRPAPQDTHGPAGVQTKGGAWPAFQTGHWELSKQ